MQCEDGPQRPPPFHSAATSCNRHRAAPMLAHSRSSQPASTCQRVHWVPASLRHAHLPEQEAGTERHPEDPYPRREGKRLASCVGPASSSGTHASRQHLSQTRGRGRLQCPLPPGFAQQRARQVGHQLLSLSAAQRTEPEGRGLAQQSVHLPTGGPWRPDCGLSLGRVGFGPRKDAVPVSRYCGSRSMCSRKQRGGGARAGWAPGLWNKSLHSSSKRDGHLAPGPQTVHQVSVGPLDDKGVLGPRQGAAGSTEHRLRACSLSSRWSVKPCPALLQWLPAWGTQGCATGQLLQPQRSTGVILDHLAPPLAGEKRRQSPPDLRRGPGGVFLFCGPLAAATEAATAQESGPHWPGLGCLPYGKKFTGTTETVGAAISLSAGR